MPYDHGQHQDILRLTVEDHPGLIMRVRPPSLQALIDLAAGTQALADLADEPATSPATLNAWRRLTAALGASLVSWTLQVNGKRVPATTRGLLSLDLPFLMGLIKAWQEGVTRSHPNVAQQRQDAPPATAPHGPVGVPLSPLNPDGTDPDTGIDEEWLSQLPAVPLAPDAEVA